MDIRMNYLDKGNGEVLILLHGNGEDSTYFSNQIEYFSRFYRVIALDTRGHGKSPRGVMPFTIGQFASDLYDFMTYMKIDRAHILGFSDGGNIAMVFAIKHPEMVSSLILNGANMYNSGVKARVQIPIIIGYRVASLFAKRCKRAKQNAEMLGLMVNDPNLKVEHLKAIKAKTLVIAGTRDMIKTSHTKLIYRSIKNAKLAIIKGDHFIANKNSKDFNRVVRRFLKNI
ncbi:3-oxoadipate enol-lactonase 2 [Clostridiales bacterium]|nr:3-oxoadipate enol-lactonase 2 [Clostridiales bacterium]